MEPKSLDIARQIERAWEERSQGSADYIDFLASHDSPHVVPYEDWKDDGSLERVGSLATPSEVERALDEFLKAREEERLCALSSYDVLFAAGLLDEMSDNK